MVVVVGAGPAGAVAARTLALGGMPVTLLDRAAFPRSKPCGGGISIRVLRRFPWLDRELQAIATHRISRLCLEGPDGQSAIITADAPAVLMIRRVEFDHLLVRAARQAGAAFVPDVDIVRARQTADAVVLEARDGRAFEAPIVIAADGVHSIVARRLGLNRGWSARSVALDMMEETPREALAAADPSTLWVSYGYGVGRVAAGRRGSPEGYAYIFPKRDHVNVGVGYVLEYFRRSVDRHPYEVQQELVDGLQKRGVLAGRSVRRHFTPFIIPIAGPLDRPGGGRVLLAGDAGGFVNGFTAEGIYYAMVTGEHAARAVLETAPADVAARLARGYRRRCAKEIGDELRDSVLVQRYLFADRQRIARVIAAVQRSPAAARLVVDYASGRRPYAAIRRTVLGRAPFAAAALFLQYYLERVAKSSGT
jgi:geranylgeranyl reductase family protein